MRSCPAMRSFPTLICCSKSKSFSSHWTLINSMWLRRPICWADDGNGGSVKEMYCACTVLVKCVSAGGPFGEKMNHQIYIILYIQSFNRTHHTCTKHTHTQILYSKKVMMIVTSCSSSNRKLRRSSVFYYVSTCKNYLYV